MSAIQSRSRWRPLLLALAILALSSTLVAAGTGYALPAWTLAPGGEPIDGGSYTLRAAIGQPATGLSSGGEYKLRRGYTLAGVAAETNLFLPLVVKG